MKPGVLSTATGLMALTAPVTALLPSHFSRSIHKRDIVDDATGNVSKVFEDLKKLNQSGAGVFEQLIDHNDPSKGTFGMRYWWSSEFYAGPGSPVVVFTPGEQHADAFPAWLSNATIVGEFAQAIGGASLLYEHRYYGESSPYQDQSTKNLQHLTIDNVLKDGTYLAKNVELPFDPDRTSDPSKAPWIYTGGSYSGAIGAWTATIDPGVFWAYHASSAIVQAVKDFWFYYEPVAQGMPKNCSADIQRAVGYMDNVLMHGSDKEVHDLKKRFLLEDVERADDFMIALYLGPVLWQTHTFVTGYHPFFEFCDYVENRWPNTTEPQPGADGVGTEKAVAGYAKWVSEKVVPGYCAALGYPEWTDPMETACFSTTDPDSPSFKDTRVRNPSLRQYQWSLCHEPMNWWFTGPPEDEEPLLISRTIKWDSYWERQCPMYFPDEDGFTFKSNRTVDDFNEWTGGWSTVDTPRIVRSDGEFDPWRQASVSSLRRPGGPWKGTDDLPVHIIPGGIHASDFIGANAKASDDVRKTIDAEVDLVSKWVDEFYDKHGGRKHGGRHH